MENFIVSAFIDLIKNAITNWVGKGVAVLKEQREYNSFLKDIENWCDDFINNNETSVVASSAFFDYIKYYKLIDNLIDFIQHPKSESEESFLAECNEKAKTYLTEKRTLPPDDIRSIKEFIAGVFEKTRKFYEEKLSVNDTILHYDIKQTSAKIEEVAEDVREMKEVLFSKKSIVVKKEYNKPQNTITRKFALYKDIQESFYFLLRSEDMLDVCLRDKHIVLLGEAGCGKTIAIEQLAAMVGATEYYPLRYNLNDYTNETIEQIIAETYQEIEYDKLFIIFDAYDEIEEENRKAFARRINKFTSNNPETIILVSSRNNFYTFANDNGEGGLFKSFKEYGISPITSADIASYIENNGICSELFYSEIKKNELYNLLTTPFYLKELIEIYRRNSALPTKANLMEEIIRNRFGEDCQKYATTIAMEDYEYKLFSCLEKLAFAIQCMRLVKISSRDYQDLIRDEKLRNLIKYSGIFSKGADGKWSFEHNNFREYLTAKYINQLNIEEIKELICTSQKKVLDSWLNVLSFLVLIREDDDLLQYLIENDPQMIVRFERSRVDETIRDEIVIKILNDFAQKNIWISRSINSSELIAKFGQSQKVCEYLIQQIQTPINFRAQYNALSVLSEFSELYGMQEVIQKALVDALKSDSVRYHEKYKVLDSLVSLKLQNNDITTYIVESYSKDMDPHYRLGVLKYLHESNLYERYIDIFVDEYEQVEKHFDESTSIRYEILDVFVKVKEIRAICKVIISLGSHRHVYSHDEEQQGVVISNAIAIYNDGHKEVFDAVFEVLVEAELYNHSFFKQSIEFFEKTGTKLEAFMNLIHSDPELSSYKAIHSILKLADESCYMHLLSRYEEDPSGYGKIVKELASWFEENSISYNKYKEALLQNGIVVPERKPPFDRQKAMQCGLQHYFDCLFDKDKYCRLISKMLKSMDKDSISFSELNSMDYHPVNYHDTSNSVEEYALLQLYFSLHAYNEENENDVYNTVKSIADWNYFIITESYNILQRDGEFDFSEYQRQFFETYCREQLKDIDLEKEICDNEKGNTISTPRSRKFLFFSQYFDFQYEKSVYLDMLFVPSYFFKLRDGDHGKFSSYVVSKLSFSEIKERVKHNLSEATMCADAWDMHIQFCRDNNLDWGVQKAIQICQNTLTESWRKHRCVEYIEQVKGYEFVYSTFLNTEDKDIIESIIYTTQKYKDNRLKERLETMNRNSSNKHIYLNTLITLNSQYALQKYAEIVKDTMKASDMSDGTGIDSTIEAISTIQEINLLDEIGLLREILFMPSFQDKKEFGLQNSLYKAYENLARNNYDLVKAHLETALKQGEVSDSEKCFCNSLIMDIESINRQKSDVAWTINKIHMFWKEHET